MTGFRKEIAVMMRLRNFREHFPSWNLPFRHGLCRHVKRRSVRAAIWSGFARYCSL